MSLPRDGGGPATPADVVRLEQQRGSQSWSGPQGSTDAWFLTQDWWNRGIYQVINIHAAYAAAIGKIG